MTAVNTKKLVQGMDDDLQGSSELGQEFNIVHVFEFEGGRLYEQVRRAIKRCFRDWGLHGVHLASPTGFCPLLRRGQVLEMGVCREVNHE